MDRSDILLNTNPYLQLNLGLSPIQMRPEFTDLFHTNYDSSHDSPKCIQGFQKKMMVMYILEVLICYTDRNYQIFKKLIEVGKDKNATQMKLLKLKNINAHYSPNF